MLERVNPKAIPESDEVLSERRQRTERNLLLTFASVVVLFGILCFMLLNLRA